jgi:GAF domain-containing protein
MLAEENSGQPVLRAGKNLPNLSAMRPNQPWDDGISSLLMLSGEGLTLAGPALARLRAGQVVKAAVAVPLKARDKVVGVIVVGNRTGKAFTERDQAMLAAVADYAVIAIVNARLFQAMEARAHSLQQAYEAQVSANARRDEALQRTVQQLRAPVTQARLGLEAMVNGQPSGLTVQQADSIHGALDRLATLQRYLDELMPAGPAGPG